MIAKKHIISSILTITVVATILLATQSQAVSFELTPSKTTYEPDEIINFKLNIELTQVERENLEKISVKINSSTNTYYCDFKPNTTIINCNENYINITNINENITGYQTQTNIYKIEFLPPTKYEDTFTISAYATINKEIYKNENLMIIEIKNQNQIETFDNLSISKLSYSSKNYTNNNITWEITESKLSTSTYEIEQNTLLLRGSSYNSSIKTKLQKPISKIKFDLKKAYTASGTRKIALYIDNKLINISPNLTNTSTFTFITEIINSTKEPSIEIKAIGTKQICIDNIEIT